MALKDSCDFCGAPAHCWQGDAAWCLSDACHQRHEWATCEPHLIPRMDPTPVQCFIGLLMYWLAMAVAQLFPARWLVWHPDSLRGRATAWVYGWAYFWAERSEGRI